MEDILDCSQSEEVEHVFLTDQFKKCCPFFISIGMTYEQFWYDDPTIANDYLEAFKLKEKREAEKHRWMTWEQGLYVYEAICDVAPILRAFSKSTKPLPYPKKPYGYDNNPYEEDEKQKELKEELNKYKVQISLMNWANQTKKRFQNK